MFDPLAAMLLWYLCGLRDGLTLSWIGVDVGIDVECADMIGMAMLALEHKGAPRKQARESG
jgi:hypothetical protein